MSKKYCRTQYTLGGSQPYVLTAQWPHAFTPKQTYWKPDYSLQGVKGYNDVEKYHPVGYIPTGGRFTPVPCDKRELNEFKIQ